jgi:hypothetical protein
MMNCKNPECNINLQGRKKSVSGCKKKVNKCKIRVQPGLETLNP